MSGLTTRQLASKQLRKSRRKHSNQLQPGQMLQDRYQIMGTLGVGGFSAVYQARDMRFPTVTKLCAVKEMTIMAPDPQMREISISLFEREANILATLDHPAIPTVYDYFTEGDRSYLVMEFIRGKDFDALLAEQKKNIQENKVLDWALQICEVLSYLHSQKPQPVVFRDMKPSNIILDPNGRIHLIDFGIAKVFENDYKGTTIGTEGYSPPEQYRGEAGPPGDVYALGATLHHMLTMKDPRLEPPFSFNERPINAYHDEVSQPFVDVVMRCLAYNVEERYPDAIALKGALLQLSEPVITRSVYVPGQETRILDGTGSATGSNNSNATVPATAVANAGDEPAPAAAGETAAAATNEISPLWTFQCEDEVRSTCAVADGTLFAGVYDNNLYALTMDTGKFIWKFPAEDEIASSPAVYQDQVFVGSSDHHLYAIQANSGRLSWRFETKGAVYSSPHVEFEHIFFGSDDGHLYAVNTTSGRQVWKVEAHSAVRSSPTIQGDSIFFGSEGGYVFCVNLTGEKKWQFQARRAVTSTPAYGEGLVVFGSLDATVYAVDANTGWAVWRYRTRRPVLSSPTIFGDSVYVGSSDGALYALDIDSGRKRWDFTTEGQIACRPAVWDDAVYFGATDGNLYCLDIKRGQLRWRFDAGGHLVGSPAIVNGIIYFGSTNHRLYALPA